MTQTTNRLLDEVAKLMTDAAGAAQGVRRELDTLVRSQAERFVTDMELVKREEFEVLRELAMRLAEENEALRARMAELERRAGLGPSSQPDPAASI
jgi:hypothetical protein